MKLAIVDSRIRPSDERGLLVRGYKVITLPPFSRLSEAVASHPDMLISRIGNDYISFADYCEEASYVFTDLSLFLAGTGARFLFTSDDVKKEYPHDVGLNALRMNNKLFCRVKSASKTLIETAKELGLEIVDTKQGYPACTVLKLSDNAAITSDDGMAKLLSEHGIRVTKITKGNISLPPYEYGFIGGAGTAHEGKLYFYGNPRLHPDEKDIVRAAEQEGLEIIALSDLPLCDLGGILFV